MGTQLTRAQPFSSLGSVSVHVSAEIEKRLADLAAQTGRAPEQVIDDALRGYERLRRGTLDWSQCAAVESIPGKVSGAWVLKDTRMPVSTIFENLEAGMSVDEVVEEFDVTRDQIRALLDFVTRSLDQPARHSPQIGSR